MTLRWIWFKLKLLWKNTTPQTLFGRSILILITPLFLTISISVFVFFDRHWSTTTTRLTSAIAGEVAMIADSWDKLDDPTEERYLINIANEKLGFIISFTPHNRLPQSRALKVPGVFDPLQKALDENLTHKFSVTPSIKHPYFITIYAQVKNGTLLIDIPQKRIFSTTTYIFLLFLLGSALLLVIIAIVFMRNQIRPIRNLAYAAEQFGKGIDSPRFKPTGAREVRQAALSFLDMRDRIKRQITQRTEMLAGVSHDLRTPLTRLKLQLAMLPKNVDTDLMRDDINAMDKMINSYLDFAKSESLESAMQYDVVDLLQQSVADAQRHGQSIIVDLPDTSIILAVRPDALQRVFANLLDNARLYASKTWVTLNKLSRNVEIIFDDDGPGIPENLRNDVFKPFHRLDASRNQDIEGTGLGLTIARDIVQSHGGTITLDTSPQGGLRVLIYLPL